MADNRKHKSGKGDGEVTRMEQTIETDLVHKRQALAQNMEPGLAIPPAGSGRSKMRAEPRKEP